MACLVILEDYLKIHVLFAAVESAVGAAEASAVVSRFKDPAQILLASLGCGNYAY